MPMNIADSVIDGMKFCRVCKFNLIRDVREG